MTTVKISYLERETCENRLKSDAAIKDVAWGDGPFVSAERMGWNRDFKGNKVHWDCYPVSWNFLDFMGIEIVEGRKFTPSDEQSENGVYILNETAQKMYDIHLGDQIQGHTDVLAIVISLMGVFGLVMFETEHRRKEIGIRRVHGAMVKQILAMFNSRFVKIVLVCFVIAVPLSVVIMQRYLEGFAYRIRLFGWVFAVALLAVLAVTVAVVTLRSLRAATVNPVKSLRTE